MIEAALKTVNRDVVLYSRDGQTDLHLRGKRVHLGTGGAAVLILDLETGRRAKPACATCTISGGWSRRWTTSIFICARSCARDMSNDDIDINTFYAA